MRKIYLTLAVAFSALMADAQSLGTQTWTSTVTPVENSDDLFRNAPLAVAKDGSSYVTGTYTTDLEFGDNYLEPVATSAYIAKFSPDGVPGWAVGLKGAATVTAITTDAEGNVYAAGVFAEEVVVGSTDDKTQTIKGMADVTDQTSAFVVKYDKDGKLLAVKTVIPETDSEMAANEMYFGTPSFNPKKVVVADGKLYLSASYMAVANIDGLTLNGTYTGDGFYVDQASICVVSLDASTLDGAALVAILGASAKTNVDQYGPEDVNFVVDGSKVYAAFVAYGMDLTLTTPKGDDKLSFAYADGKNEHAYVLAAIDGSATTLKTFNSQPNENSAAFNTIDEMTLSDGNIYLGGTFNEALAFDNNISYKGACDTYLASLKASDFSLNYAVANGYDEGDAKKFNEAVSGMVVTEGNVLLTGYAENMDDKTISTPLTHLVDTKGTMTDGPEMLVTAVADNGNTAVASTVKDNSYIYTAYALPTSGINGTTVSDSNISRNGDVFTFGDKTDAAVFDLSGREVLSAHGVESLSVASLGRGVYVIKAGESTVKFVK